MDTPAVPKTQPVIRDDVIAHFTSNEVSVMAGVEVKGYVAGPPEDQLRVINEAAKFYDLGVRVSSVTVFGHVDSTLQSRGFCQLTVEQTSDDKCVLKLQIQNWTHFQVAVAEILQSVHSADHPDQLHLLTSAKYTSFLFLSGIRGPVVLLLQLSTPEEAKTLHELLDVLKKLHNRRSALTFQKQDGNKFKAELEKTPKVEESVKNRENISGNYLDMTENIERSLFHETYKEDTKRISTGHMDMSRNSEVEIDSVIIEVDETNILRKGKKSSLKKASMFKLPSLKQGKVSTSEPKVCKNGKAEEDKELGGRGHDILMRKQSSQSTSSAKEKAEAISERLLEESEKQYLLEVDANSLPEKLQPLMENLLRFHDLLTCCLKRNSSGYGDFLKCILDNADTVRSYVTCYDLASFFGKKSDLAIKLMLKLTTLREYLVQKEEEPQMKQTKGVVLLILDDTLKRMKERRILWEVDQDKVQLLDCGEILFQGDVQRSTVKKTSAVYVILMSQILMILKRVSHSFEYVTHVINDKIFAVEPNIKKQEVIITLDTKTLENILYFKAQGAGKIEELVWQLQKIADANRSRFF